MILDIIQTSKELLTADFVIKHGEKQIGSFSLKGKLYSMEADISGTLYDCVFRITYDRRLKSKETFRPYSILEFDREIGSIFRAERKISLFKGYGFRQMNCCGNTYTMYAIGMGNEGLKLPIYCGDMQIAQIEKDCIVYNGLHNYRAYIEQDVLIKVVAWFCAYLYVTGPYAPGEKVISGKTKIVSTTTNKLLKEKYNPDFKKNIEQ